MTGGPSIAKAKLWQDYCRLLNMFYHALPKGRRIITTTIEDAMRRDIAAVVLEYDGFGYV